MTLSEFMAANAITDTALALRLGVGRPYVTRIKNGKRRPSPDVALKIESLTGGKVPAASLNPQVALIERARGLAPVGAAA